MGRSSALRRWAKISARQYSLVLNWKNNNKVFHHLICIIPTCSENLRNQVHMTENRYWMSAIFRASNQLRNIFEKIIISMEGKTLISKRKYNNHILAIFRKTGTSMAQVNLNVPYSEVPTNHTSKVFPQNKPFLGRQTHSSRNNLTKIACEHNPGKTSKHWKALKRENLWHIWNMTEFGKKSRKIKRLCWILDNLWSGLEKRDVTVLTTEKQSTEHVSFGNTTGIYWSFGRVTSYSLSVNKLCFCCIAPNYLCLSSVLQNTEGLWIIQFQ